MTMYVLTERNEEQGDSIHAASESLEALQKLAQELADESRDCAEMKPIELAWGIDSFDEDFFVSNNIFPTVDVFFEITSIKVLT